MNETTTTLIMAGVVLVVILYSVVNGTENLPTILGALFGLYAGAQLYQRRKKKKEKSAE